MGKRAALTVMLVALAVLSGSASGRVSGAPGVSIGARTLLDRFLAPDDRPLVSYRAFRHLSASTRGGRMTAAIDAWTSLDPQHGFTYEVTDAEGSGLIQKKVLIAALDAEQDTVMSATSSAQSALTQANYEFLDMSPLGDGTVRVDVRPRRKHVMLIDGHLVLESESADLVRLEGDLSKRPSFWTRHVHVVREYERVGGVHVPVSMTSTADVLIVGQSSFSMNYKYAEINGKPIS